MRVSRLFGILVLALVVLPAQARAHLKLESSTPAQGDTLRQPVSALTLTFTETVSQEFLTVEVLDAFGRPIGVGMIVRAVGGSPSKEYMVELDTPLAGGAFTVRWKAVGRDGHAVTGMFDFLVYAAGTVPAPASADPQVHAEEHGGHHADVTEIPPLFRPESSLLWIAVRWLHFSGLVVLVGAVAFRFGVLDRMQARFGDELATSIDDAVRNTATIAAALVLFANILRFGLQYGSVHGPERMFEGELVSALLLKDAWGKVWLAQSAAAIAYLIAVRVKTADRSDSWYSAIPFAVVAAAAPAFSGHAAAVEQMAIVPILDDAVHVITASAWLGTLAVLVFAALPRVIRSEDGFARLAAMVATFSPLALAMGVLAVITGTLNAFIHINGFDELWTTPYGRILALKIGLVVLTLTLGAYNWRVVRPKLGTPASAATLRKSARAELAFAGLILVVTAILVATPTN